MKILMCVKDDFPIKDELTVGKSYEVIKESTRCYTVNGDTNLPLNFTKEPDEYGLSFATWFTLEEDTVTISKREYDQLLDDSNKLSCLEACGVDNWQGYDDAMQMYYESDSETE